MVKRELGREEVMNRLRRYCAFRERSQKEVKEKLRALQIPSSSHDSYLDALIDENFLSEERFAESYALGKFRSNGWGRNKITAGLRSKGLGGELVNLGLSQIPEEEYQARIMEMARYKWDSLSSQDDRYAKVCAFLLRKGFEGDLVRKTVLEIKGNHTKGISS